MASTFKDNAGREWSISLNASNVLDVRNKLKFDITKMFKDAEVAKLNDIEMLVNVVYLLIKPQAVVADVSDWDFGAAMAGDSFEHAVDALWDEVVLFTPSRQRPALQLIRKTGRRLEELADVEVKTITPDALAQMVLAKSATSSLGVTS